MVVVKPLQLICALDCHPIKILLVLFLLECMSWTEEDLQGIKRIQRCV